MVRRVLIFDNYDSFTFNLYHLLKVTRPDNEYFVRRNQDANIFQDDFQVLIISAGPMRPSDTGLLKNLFDDIIVPQKIPVFGVCLGMQFMAEYFGKTIQESEHPLHGVKVKINHRDEDIFEGMESPFSGARYNSLEVKPFSDSQDIKILAFEEHSNRIMALRHKTFPMVGVQFHPESFLTREGQNIMHHFFEQYVEN